MKVEVGRRYKVRGFSCIITVVAIYDEVYVEVSYDNDVTGVMAAGNCIAPSLYDEIRDLSDEEMEEFLHLIQTYGKADSALYWTKANKWFKNVDAQSKKDVMYRSQHFEGVEWLEKALQELWITNKEKEDLKNDD